LTYFTSHDKISTDKKQEETMKKELFSAYAKQTFWWFFLMFSYTIPLNLLASFLSGDFDKLLVNIFAWTLIPGIIGLMIIIALDKTEIEEVNLATIVWKRLNAIMIWHTLYRLFWKKDTLFHLF